MSTLTWKHLLHLKKLQCRHQHQFSINVWAGTVGDCLVDLHVLPHRLTGNHYWDFILCDLPKSLKTYHWQSKHKCGTFMIVLWHILAVLCEMFSVTPILTNG
jgi:hypothetical protein